MKQSLNIAALVFVLSVPFALSSQTRKAIPAGRYEALSGVKNSRTTKSSALENAENKLSSATLVWNEAQKYLDSSGIQTYYSKSALDNEWSELLTAKGITPAKKLNTSTSVVFSEDLKKDRELFRQLPKGKIVILRDKHSLEEMVGPAQSFEVLAYQALEDSRHLYLLRKK